MEVSLATPLVSRDGQLNLDAKLLNCFWEETPQGDRKVVRRPVLTPLSDTFPVASIIQGVLSNNGYNFAIQNDSVYQVPTTGGLGPFPLSVGIHPGDRYKSITPMYSPSNSVTFFKSTNMAFVMTNNTAPVKVASADYPALTVPGAAFLDGTYYVMTTLGQIYGSALNDPTTWSALNFIQVDKGLGRGVALARHLNYIVAFCEKGIQFFYDAANAAPGSPLSPVPNATSKIGCAQAYSIQEHSDRTIFLASAMGGQFVCALDGLSVTPLTESNMGRVLEYACSQLTTSSDATVYSLFFKVGGVSFYILTFWQQNLTLCLDVDRTSWAQWSSSADGVTNSAFTGVYILPSGGTSFTVLGHSDSHNYVMNVEGVSGTAHEKVNMMIRTRKLDASSSVRKTLSEISLLADTSNVTMNVRYSDDDGQTWSTNRPIDMNLPRKKLTRLGSFFSRIFEFSCFTTELVGVKALVLPDRNLPAQAAPSSE